MKRWIASLLVLATLLGLGGCSIMEGNISTLLGTPRPNKVQQQLGNAIARALGTNIKYISPASGNHRTSLVQIDLSGTGSPETVLFFLPAADAETAHLAVFTETADGQWNLTKQVAGVSGAIDYVEFADCNGDGMLDVLVGWIRGEGARELYVYDLQAVGDGVLYTDGYNESRFFTEPDGTPLLFTALFDKALGTGTAKLVAPGRDGLLSRVLSCPLDAHFDAVTNISYSRISADTRAIIFDAKSGNNAVTQLLYYDGNTLINPYVQEGTLHPDFVRETALACMDIDKDGIIEIPSAAAMPSSAALDANSTLSPAALTAWSSFNPATFSDFTRQPLLYEFSCLINAKLGYYYIYPAAWNGRVTAYTAPDHSLLLYYIDPHTGESTQLFTLSRMSGEEYNKRINTGSWYQLYRDGDRVYAIDIAQNLSPALKLLVGTVDDNRNRLILY